LADFLRIRRNIYNEYRVRILVEQRPVDVLVDTGMTSPDCLIGVGLDANNYSAVSSGLRNFQRIEMEGIGTEGADMVVGGVGRVSIEGLYDSEVETYVVDVGENLVGVCYFQCLTQYEIVWDMARGVMTVSSKGTR
jgi:predicted aspartyl protease